MYTVVRKNKKGFRSTQHSMPLLKPLEKTQKYLDVKKRMHIHLISEKHNFSLTIFRWAWILSRFFKVIFVSLHHYSFWSYSFWKDPFRIWDDQSYFKKLIKTKIAWNGKKKIGKFLHSYVQPNVQVPVVAHMLRRID